MSINSIESTKTWLFIEQWIFYLFIYFCFYSFLSLSCSCSLTFKFPISYRSIFVAPKQPFRFPFFFFRSLHTFILFIYYCYYSSIVNMGYWMWFIAFLLLIECILFGQLCTIWSTKTAATEKKKNWENLYSIESE